MTETELDRELRGLATQDLDAFRAQALRKRAHVELAQSTARPVSRWEAVLVAAACVVYLSWALMRAWTTLSG